MCTPITQYKMLRHLRWMQEQISGAAAARLTWLGTSRAKSNTKGYSSTYLAMGFANGRAGTQKRRAPPSCIAGWARTAAQREDELVTLHVAHGQAPRALVHPVVDHGAWRGRIACTAARAPCYYYKGLPSLSSRITRDCPPSLLELQGIALPPF